MPFDGQITDFAPVAVPIVAPFDFDTATGDERLIELARWLDHDQRWRDHTLVWDYANVVGTTDEGCGTSGCALGLAKIVMPGFYTFGRGYFGSAMQAFGLSADDVWFLFNGGFFSEDNSLTHDNVAPGHVATAIRQFVYNRTGA